MASRKPSLKDMLSRGAIVPTTGPVKPKVRVQSKKVRDALTSRLIANEYLRNGLNMKAAFEVVTKKTYTTQRFNAMLSADDQAFIREIDVALKAADVEKNKVLGLLWTQATSTPLDFMDDDGMILPIAELKKLPRELQALIEEVTVKTEYVLAKDENGKTIRNEDGVALQVPKNYVRIKFPSKQNALNTIAQIGKLVGPSIIQQNFITNIGQVMVDADNRRARALSERGIIEGEKGGKDKA